MNGKSAATAFIAALVIAVIAGAFYFYVDRYPAPTSNRIEEPYKRTENAPPGAVEDETAAPGLKGSKNAAPNP